jgi:hypothetical protein
MYAELAGYVTPKRRALDVSAESAPPVTIRIGIQPKVADGALESTSK